MKTILKTLLPLFLAVLLLGSLSLTVAAEEKSADVTVTVSVGGELSLAHETVHTTDRDANGVITIDEVLAAAHDTYFEGGASAGYASYVSEYGISMSKLWGVENGGAYGYMLNDTMAMSMADEVKTGDDIAAYAYTDTVTYSDAYSFFDVKEAVAEVGESLVLTLQKAGFDETWAPVTLPVANAVLTLNGETTAFVTDAEGKVTIVLDKAGKTVVSAKAEDATLVPAVCVVNVKGEENETAKTEKGCRSSVGVILLPILLLGGAVALKKKEI